MKSSKRGNIKMEYVRRIRVLILAACVLITSILGQSICTHAMTPRVMMTAYSIDKSDIYPGDTFTLKFESSNKITVEDCEFLNHRYTGLILQWCNNVTIRRNKFTEIGRMISSEYPRFVMKNSNGTFTLSNQDNIITCKLFVY